MSIDDLDINHLRCLSALAEELNFGRAAERLNMSQPPLTRLVADVERMLGARLFARTTRRVSMTPVGEVFVAEARAVLSRMDEALRNVAEEVRREAGLLRLAYEPLALHTVLPVLLKAFRGQDHDARVDLVELSGAAQKEALDAGRTDMGFSGQPIAGAGYRNVLLHREALCLAVPETHRLAGRKRITLQEVDGEPLIMHPRHEYQEYYDRVMAAYDAAGIAPAIRERQPGQNCMALVVGGDGVLLTHASFQASGLRRIEIETPLPLDAEVWANWTKKNASDRGEALIRIVNAHALRV